MSSIFLKKWEKKKTKGKIQLKKGLVICFLLNGDKLLRPFVVELNQLKWKISSKSAIMIISHVVGGDVRLVCSELSHSLAVVLWWGNLIVSGTEEGRWILYQVPVENLELMSGTEKVLLKDEKRNCPKQLSCPACNTTTSKYLQHTKWRRRITISSVLLNSQQKSCPVEH